MTAMRQLLLVVQRDNEYTGELRAPNPRPTSRVGWTPAGGCFGAKEQRRLSAVSMIGAALGARSAPGADYCVRSES